MNPACKRDREDSCNLRLAGVFHIPVDGDMSTELAGSAPRDTQKQGKATDRCNELGEARISTPFFHSHHDTCRLTIRFSAKTGIDYVRSSWSMKPEYSVRNQLNEPDVCGSSLSLPTSVTWLPCSRRKSAEDFDGTVVRPR